MSMDRAEKAGLGIAAAGHVGLFAILSAGFLASAPEPLRLKPQPIEVQLVDEVGLESAAPVPSAQEPAAKLAEVEAPIEAPTPPPLPEPAPAPQPAKAAPPPKPAPAKPKAAPPKPQPIAKAAPAKPKAAPKPPAKTGGRLKGILDGISDKDTKSAATTPKAAIASPAVQSSLRAEVLRQLKPHWRAPSGADAELLRTELSISLARNGAVTDIEVIRTTGQNASNRPQVKLHQEQAVRAVRLAAPFKLPDEFYDAWKLLRPIGFDKRLSQ